MQLTNPRVIGGGLVLVWIGLLVYLALLDRLPTTLGTSSSAQSLGHFATHIVLSYLFLLNLSLWRRGDNRLTSAGLAVGGSLAVAASLEAVQAFSASRDAALSDLVYSGAGAVLGGGIGLLLTEWRLSYRWLWGGAGVLVFGPLTFTLLAMVLWDTSVPRIGDHWHARYRITICGTDVPPFGDTPGGVHTHSGGIIHVHPKSDAEAGSNATLGLFIANAGGSLTEGSLLLPDGKHIKNGDSCGSSGRGHLALWVNGIAVNPVPSYVPQDRDEIILTFDP